MTAEPEQQVRDALRRRADEVTPERLQYRDGPRAAGPPPRRGRRSWWVPASAVATVLVIAAVVAPVASRGTRRGAPVASSAGVATRTLAGQDWRLTAVREPGGARVQVPDRVGADVAFERGGADLDGQDGVNHFAARYTVDEGGRLHVRSQGSTAIGYAGLDAAVLAAVAGVGAVLERDGVVSVQVAGGQLRLAAHGYTLTYRFGAPVATSAHPPATGR